MEFESFGFYECIKLERVEHDHCHRENIGNGNYGK